MVTLSNRAVSHMERVAAIRSDFGVVASCIDRLRCRDRAAEPRTISPEARLIPPLPQPNTDADQSAPSPEKRPRMKKRNC